MPDWLIPLLAILAIGAGAGTTLSWFMSREKRKHFDSYAVLFLTGDTGRRIVNNLITQQLSTPLNQKLTYDLIDLWASTVHGQEILTGTVPEATDG